MDKGAQLGNCRVIDWKVGIMPCGRQTSQSTGVVEAAAVHRVKSMNV